MDFRIEDGRDDLPMFIHSEIDDLGLNAYEFRIYARLVRRAGKTGACTESVRSMAEACRISERTIQRSLKTLEDMGMITREDRHGETSVFKLTSRKNWTPAPQSPPHHSHPTPAPQSPKGIPFKERDINAGAKKPVVFEEEWEKFQAAYPKGSRQDVNQARTVLQGVMMAGTDLSLVIEGAKKYAAHCKRTGIEPKYIKTPSNWLRSAGWADVYPDQEPKPKKKPSYDPATVCL